MWVLSAHHDDSIPTDWKVLSKVRRYIADTSNLLVKQPIMKTEYSTDWKVMSKVRTLQIPDTSKPLVKQKSVN